MESEPLKQLQVGFLGRVFEKLKPYRYPILVLAIGVGLMLLPESNMSDVDQSEEMPVKQEIDLEEKLEVILGEIEGAGRVKVLLTVDTGTAVTYQEDRQQFEEGDRKEQEVKTVLVSENGDDVPIVVKTKYPVYKGAVVVCEGADRASVKLNIVQAVSSLTGLGSDKITVVKMKG